MSRVVGQIYDDLATVRVSSASHALIDGGLNTHMRGGGIIITENILIHESGLTRDGPK